MTLHREPFDKLLNELAIGMEKQRALHASAFGKKNAMEIIQRADANRKRLEGWREDLKLLDSEMSSSGLFDVPAKHTGRARRPNDATETRGASMTGKRPAEIVIFGEIYPVTLWSELLTKVTQVLCEKDIHHADLLIESKELNRIRRNFSRQSEDIHIRPRYVPGCSLYVETNKNARNIYELCYKMILLCGYRKDDMKIILEV